MRIVLVFVLALMGFGAFAQEGSQYIGTKEGAVRVRGTLYADSGFYLPKRPLRSARIYDTGAVYYQLSDSSAYVWTGSQWNKIGSETTSAGNLISKTLGVYSFPGTWSSDVTLDGAVSSNPTRSWIMSNLYQFKVTDGVMAIGMPGEASSSPYMGTKYSPNNDFDTAVSVRATGTKVSGGNVIINANTSVKVTGSPLSTSTDTTTYKPAALASDGTLKRMASWPAASGGGEINTISSVGSGTSIVKGKTGVDLQLKSLTSDTTIAVTGNTNDVQVKVDQARIASVGRLADTASSLRSLINAGDTIYVAHPGTGTRIGYISGDTLQLKRLQAGTNVTLTSNADSSITIAASGGGGSSVVDYYNIQTAGADSTGATDVSSYIIAGFATGKPVYIPKGTYLVSSAITIPTWGMIIGDGNRSVIKTTSNISVFIGGNYASVKDIKIIGNDGTSSQIGISIDGTGGMQVTNCWFVDLGVAIKVQNTNGFYGVGGLTTTQIIIESSGYGIYALNQGEYINASNFNIRNNTYGIYNGGGNNIFSTGNITDCTYGFYLATGTNDGHATASAVKINHCTNTLYATGINNGYKFVGCMFYYGTISVISSSNVQFSECDINVTAGSLVMTSAAGTYFRNCNFYGTTTWSITGTKPMVINDTSPSSGIRFDLAGENKPVDFYTSNGFATFGGSTIQRFLFQKPIFGANGPATYTHDVNVGSFNMDYAVSQALSDPFRVFNPSSSGGTVAAFMANQLASVGYYAMRIMNTGNIAIHQNNATARVHILGSTATANTAPLKFVSGTNMTTPENGAFEYDGSHLYFTPSGATRKKFPLMPNSTSSNGSLLYGNGTDFSLLSAGSDGRVLTLASGLPSWADITTENTYSPTRTDVTNIGTSSVSTCHYMRVGNTIEIWGEITIDPTATGNTQVDLSLPISSALTNTYDVSGSAVTYDNNQVFRVYADTTNGRMIFRGNASVDNASHVYSFKVTVKYIAP